MNDDFDEGYAAGYKAAMLETHRVIRWTFDNKDELRQRDGPQWLRIMILSYDDHCEYVALGDQNMVLNFNDPCEHIAHGDQPKGARDIPDNVVVLDGYQR